METGTLFASVCPLNPFLPLSGVSAHLVPSTTERQTGRWGGIVLLIQFRSDQRPRVESKTRSDSNDQRATCCVLRASLHTCRSHPRNVATPLSALLDSESRMDKAPVFSAEAAVLPGQDARYPLAPRWRWTVNVR